MLPLQTLVLTQAPRMLLTEREPHRSAPADAKYARCARQPPAHAPAAGAPRNTRCAPAPARIPPPQAGRMPSPPSRGSRLPFWQAPAWKAGAAPAPLRRIRCRRACSDTGTRICWNHPCLPCRIRTPCNPPSWLSSVAPGRSRHAAYNARDRLVRLRFIEPTKNHLVLSQCNVWSDSGLITSSKISGIRLENPHGAVVISQPTQANHSHARRHHDR